MRNRGILLILGLISVVLASGCTQPSPASQTCEYRFYVGVSGFLPVNDYANYTDFESGSTVSEIEFPEVNCRCEWSTDNETKCTYVTLVISVLDDDFNVIKQRKDSDMIIPWKPRQWFLERCYCGAELMRIYS